MRINKLKALRSRQEIELLKDNQKVSIDKLLGVKRSNQKITQISNSQAENKSLDRYQFLDRYQIHNVSLSTLSKSWYQNFKAQSSDQNQQIIPRKTLTNYKQSILCDLKQKIIQQSLSPNKSIESVNKEGLGMTRETNYKTINPPVYKQLFQSSMNNQFNFNKSKKQLLRWKQQLFMMKKSGQHPNFATCELHHNPLMRLPKVEDFHMNLTRNLKNKQIFYKKAKRLHNPQIIKRNSYSPWHSFGQTRDLWAYKIVQKPQA